MGRTREFDMEAALEVAAKLFWGKGYEGTSLAELTGGMGINPPSFYIAFKSKAALFRLVLQRYREQYLGFAMEALEEKTAKAVAERLLTGYADLLSSPEHPPGCLAMNSAWVSDGDGIREELKEHREFRKKSLRKRFQRAISEGDLPAGTSAEALANYVMVVAWGMALEGQSGAKRSTLKALAKSAMNAWPQQPRSSGVRDAHGSRASKKTARGLLG